MSEPDGARRSAIERELRRVEERAMWSAQMQLEGTKLWRGVNLTLGIPASTLAAASGVTALAVTTGRVAAGIIALAAAAFGATLTTVNASQRMNQAASAGNAYLEIQTAARQMREIDLPTMDLDEARAALGEITARLDEQNKTAEPPSKRLYKKARRNLEGGGQNYEADEPPSQGRGEPS